MNPGTGRAYALSPPPRLLLLATVLPLLVLALPGGAARLEIDPQHPSIPVAENLWGGHVHYSQDRSWWTDPQTLPAIVSLGINSMRWPDGSGANGYDWKRHAEFQNPPLEDGIDAARFLLLLQRHEMEGASPVDATLVFRFGTGSATDGRDFVEFFLGPASSPWGARRDSMLAALGATPGPAAIRTIEIGNEILGPWEWATSWTAEDPRAYFFGGDAWRDYRPQHPYATDIPDVFSAADLTATQAESLLVRFPVFDPDSLALYWTPTREAGPSQWHLWQEIDDLAQAGPDDSVYVVLPDSNGIRIGDGTTHGARPDSGFLILFFKTLHHDGAVAIASAMRTRLAEPDIDLAIPIGTCALPDSDSFTSAELDAIADAFDFQIRHQYGSEPGPTGADTLNHAGILAQLEPFRRTWDRAESIAEVTGLSWAVTEWNYSLGVEDVDAGLMGPGAAAFTAGYLAEMATRDLPHRLGAWHFSTLSTGGPLQLLHLVNGAIVWTTKATGFALAHRACRGRRLPITIGEIDSVAVRFGGTVLDSIPPVPEILSYGSIEEDTVRVLLLVARDDHAVDCTVSAADVLYDVRLERYSPTGPGADADLVADTLALPTGAEVDFSLPPRSLALLVARLGAPQAVPDDPAEGRTKLASSSLRAVSTPSRQPRIRWQAVEEGKVRLYDVRGRLVTTVPVHAGSGSWRLPEPLPAGIYWARLHGADAVIVKVE